MSRIEGTISNLESVLASLTETKNSINSLSTREEMISFVNSRTGFASELVKHGLAFEDNNQVILYESVTTTQLQSFLLEEINAHSEAVGDAIINLQSLLKGS